MHERTDSWLSLRRAWLQILNPGYPVDERQEHVAVLCDNVKTYHSDSGFVGGFVIPTVGRSPTRVQQFLTRPGTVRKRQKKRLPTTCPGRSAPMIPPRHKPPKKQNSGSTPETGPISLGTVVDARCRSAMELA